MLNTLSHINFRDNDLNIPIHLFSKLYKLSFLQIDKNNYTYGNSSSWKKDLTRLDEKKVWMDEDELY